MQDLSSNEKPSLDPKFKSYDNDKMKIQKFILCGLLFSFSAARAAESITVNPWSEIRFIGMFNKLAKTPDDLNAETAGDKVNPLKDITEFGIEGNAHILPFFKLGLRFGGSWTQMIPSNNPSTPTSFLAVQQAYGGIIGRIPIVDDKVLRLDVFGEAGLTRTHVDVQTSSGAGTYSKDGSPFERVGASLGLGWDTIFFFVEAGNEWNKLDGMTFQGNISSPISSIDLSGFYYGVGVTFNGLPHFLKPSK